MSSAGSVEFCDMHGGDFATDGEWIVVCPEPGEPHDLQVSKHPFSRAQGVTCERGHQFAWTEAEALAVGSRERTPASSLRSPMTRPLDRVE